MVGPPLFSPSEPMISKKRYYVQYNVCFIFLPANRVAFLHSDLAVSKYSNAHHVDTSLTGIVPLALFTAASSRHMQTSSGSQRLYYP